MALVSGGVGGDSSRRRGCCFGPASTGTLLTFNGSRWKLWSEKEAAAEVAHSDPSEAYTAACWGPGPQSLALGCASGRMQAWDPYAGELLGPTAEAFRAVARGADCSVTAIAASDPARSSVFAGCQAVPEILEIGVPEGVTRRSISAGKAGICRLAACGSGLSSPTWLLAAGAGATALKFWRLPASSGSNGTNPEKLKVTAKLSGPSNPSSCLDMCHLRGEASTRTLALCADGTMQIDVFSLDKIFDDANQGRQAPVAAAIVLSSHEKIESARFAPPLSDSQMRIVGYGPTIIAFWTFSSELGNGSQESRKTIAPTMIVSFEDIGGRVLCAHGVSNSAVVAAFGPLAHPAFAVMREPASSSSGSRAVIEHLGSSTNNSQRPAETKAKAAPTQATVLGPLQAIVPRKHSQRKRQAEDIGEKEGENTQKHMKLATGGRVPGGLSMAPVVRQALRAKDGHSMDKVLQTCEKRVIDSTVAELSGSEAFDTLQECTKKLVLFPMIAPTLALWIQRVLVRHFAFIHSQPVLRNALQPLSEALQARCGTHRALVRLQGRLQMARHFGRQALEKRKQERENQYEPLLVYAEGDEDAEEDEEASSDAGEGCSDEDAEGMDPDDSDDWLDMDDE